MSYREEALRKRIRTIMPDLRIKELDLNDEGLVNDVVIVNKEYVFRFAKTEQGAADLIGERRVLDVIRPTAGVDIPTPLYCGNTCMVYPFIHGEPLLLERIRGLDGSSQVYLAETLGTFLSNLHAIDITGVRPELPATLAPVDRKRWLKIYQGIKESVYPLLWKHQVRWAEGVFDRMLNDEAYFDFEPALIHGDLRQYHILTDDNNRAVKGVIDFGVAGRGDPASDFGTLINTYGESFVAKMQKTYPTLDSFMVRARFYAQALELQWAWLGLEFKENFWFIAHLGCARDLHT